MKPIRAVLAVLALAVITCAALAWAEPTYIAVSATQVVQSVSLPTYTKTVTIVSDGADTCYFRLFTDADTPGNATTSSSPLPRDASISYEHSAYEQSNLTHPVGVRDSEAPSLYYKSLSVICAAGKTASWRVYAK